MFYQQQNSLTENNLKMENGIDFAFPAHLHDAFEFITVTEGEMVVTVDKKKYSLLAGEKLLVFPNQVHELSTPCHSRHFLCIFSPKLVQAYNKTYLSRVPEDNLFEIDDFYVEKLMKLDENAQITIIKGLLYSICGEFDAVARYKERKSEKDGLLLRIFKFVENNYSTECSLKELAHKTSYNYVYLSKYFKECTGISFTDYVNRYRVNEACYIIGSAEYTMLKVAYECGFDSLRTFNRNFRKIMGVTPSEYKKRL